MSDRIYGGIIGDLTRNTERNYLIYPIKCRYRSYRMDYYRDYGTRGGTRSRVENKLSRYSGHHRDRLEVYTGRFRSI